LVNVEVLNSSRHHYILTFTLYGLCDLIYKQIVIIVGVQMKITNKHNPALTQIKILRRWGVLFGGRDEL